MADAQSDRVSVPTLVMTGGPLDGTAYPLPLTRGEAIVGSSMDAGVQIMLGNVEPFHARVVLDPAGLVIEDAGSATGTFVNGEKVEGRHPLEDGDRVCLGPPGAKGSAKLLVRLPGAARGASPALAADAAAPALDGPLAAPFFGQEPALAFSAEEESTEAQEFDLSSEMVFDSQPLVVEGDVSGPPLEAAEFAPTEDEGDALFATPLPPAAPRDPFRPAPPPPSWVTAPPPPPPSFVPPPPAPPPPAPPPPPSPPRPAAERLTAPPPPAPPPAPALTEAPRPEYQTELPSIPVESPAAPSEFPPLRPAPKPAARTPAKGTGRPASKRRRSFSLPSIPILPILGGTAGLAAVAGLVWFFFIRGTPPEVASITPDSVEKGQTVTLAGKHFAGKAAGNTVLFGTARAQVTKASDTVLEVVVPAGVKAQVPVVVQTKGGRSKPVTLTVLGTAQATGLEPDVALPGQVVLVKGAGFQGQKLTARVGGGSRLPPSRRPPRARG